MKECLICFENLYTGVSLIEYFTYRDIICGRCRAKMIPVGEYREIEGMHIFVLYEYNEFMESLLFQFKEGRDIALKSLFFYRWNKTINDKFKGWTIAFMPSGVKRIQERGFYPLQEMLSEISLLKMDLFEKTKEYKQSQMNYKQRKGIHKVIKRKKGISLQETKLLLVDDVITSGNTLLSAFALVKDAKQTAILVLCDNHHNVEKCD